MCENYRCMKRNTLVYHNYSVVQKAIIIINKYYTANDRNTIINHSRAPAT